MDQRTFSAPRLGSEARLQAHWAAQIVSAAGASLAEPSADFSHTALSWTAGRLQGTAVSNGRRLALEPAEGRLVVLSEDGGVEQSETLSGRTLEEGLALAGEWLGAALTRPTHDLPAHPLSQGDRFDFGTHAGEAVAEWFSFAAAALDGALAELELSLPVIVWPHHFDMAALWVLEGSGEDVRSVGIGFSPGDGSYDEPYFYVSPWPYPEIERLPELAFGHWHTEGFTAAVLTASALREAGASSAAAFLEAAFSAGRSLLVVE